MLITLNGISQIDENLLLHYKFNGNALDQTANGHDGIENGVSYVEDRNGNANKAVYFDGINDFIDFPNTSTLKPQLPVSFSFWVKYDSFDHEDRALFNTSFENDRSSGIYFNTQISSGKYAVNYGDGSPFYNPTARRSFVSETAIENTEWHHVVAVVSGPLNMKIYVDCIDLGGTYSGQGDQLFYSLTAGSLGRNDRDLNADPLYFKGAIDDFRYYNKAIDLNDAMILCDPLLSTENSETSTILTLYPNPAQNELQIISDSKDFESINIYDSLGNLVLKTTFSNKISVESFKNGFYFVIFNGTRKNEIKKLIIKK